MSEEEGERGRESILLSLQEVLFIRLSMEKKKKSVRCEAGGASWESPGASWEGQLRGVRGGDGGKKRTERFWYVVVP